MTSKNSYWKLSKSNFKRRMPYFVLSFLFCLILMPILTYLECVTYAHNMSYYDRKYIVSALARELAIEGYLHDAITIALAVMFAITGNAWNNSQKKNDFYKSLPVKGKTRFVYIHVNSCISFLICFGCNLLLSNIIIACFKIYDSSFIVASVYSFVTHFLEFVAVYMLAVIAQYLTGNSVLAICGAGILGMAEPIFRILLNIFREQWYKTYMYSFDNYLDAIYNSLTSPVAGILKAHGSISRTYGSFYLASNYSDIWLGIIKTLVQIVIYTAIAFFIYNRRPAQGGNRNIVFEKTKPFIKDLIMVAVIIVSVLVFMENGNNGVFNVIFGLLLGFAVMHVVLQYAIEGDFAAVKKGLPSSLVACLIVTLLVVFFYLNGVRYDEYLPDVAEIEGIGICTGYEYEYNFYDSNENNSYLSSREYFLNNALITDEKFINEVVEVLKKDISNGTYYYDEEWINNTQFSGVDIAFRLKNGKTVLRTYVLPIEDYSTVWYAMFDSEEYRYASNQLEYEGNINSLENAEKIEIEYINYNFSKYDTCPIESKELQDKIIKAVVDDYNARTSEVYKKQIPIGYIEISGEMVRGIHPSFTYQVYSSDINTIAVLKLLGYEPATMDKTLIEKIEIMKYDNDEAAEGTTKTVILTPDDDMFYDVLENVVFHEAFYRSQIVDKFSTEYDVYIYTPGGISYSAVIMNSDKINGLSEKFK